MDEILLLFLFGGVVVLILKQLNQSGDSGGGISANEDLSTNVDTGIVISDAQSQPGRLMQLADAIFHFEGGKAGDLNVRNNNPGNLKFENQPGAVKGPNDFAVFDSINDGWAALYRQLQKSLSEFPQLDFNQFFARWLGQRDYINPRVTNQGDPFKYAKFVAGKLGVSADQTLGQIFGG